MSKKPNIVVRGVNDEDIIVEKSYRSTKSNLVRTLEGFGEKVPNAFILCTLSGIGFVFPATLLLCLVLYFPFFLYRKHLVDNQRLPFRCPKIINREDLGDPKPGRKAFAKAEGIFYVGREKNTNYQLWLKLKDLLTHMLVFGTTGSGKTVFLLSQAFNAIAFGSGFIYIDPKGSPSLAFQIFYLARKLGRDDDYRLLNFNLGDLDLSRRTPKCMSNTMNPFAAPSTPDDIIQMMSAVLPADGGSNAIFSQNGKTLIEGVTNALCCLRDKKLLEMFPASFVEVLSPRKSDELARDKRLSPMAKEHINKALTGLGWDEKTTDFAKQPKNFPEQYAYARSYFTEITNKFTFSYGNIFNHKRGEIDMRDIILQRRIAVVILPSLGKSEKENKSIGQIVLSAVKQATAVGLGKKIEGKASDVLGSLPTDSPTPFLIITDEYAAISVEGYATVLTQGRSLGIAAIVASQDYGGIKKADEVGAKQIIANTKVKFFLKNEDPNDTLQLINDIAGKAQVLKSSGYERKDGSYIQRGDLSYDMLDRINPRDLQEQTEGEFHALFNGEITRGDSFYADPPIKSSDELRLRIMLSVLRPEKKDLMEHINGQEKAEEVINKLLNDEKLDITLPEINQTILSKIVKNIKRFSQYDNIIKMILSLLAVQKETPEISNAMKQAIDTELTESLDDDHMIFEDSSEDDDIFEIPAADDRYNGYNIFNDLPVEPEVNRKHPDRDYAPPAARIHHRRERSFYDDEFIERTIRHKETRPIINKVDSYEDEYEKFIKNNIQKKKELSNQDFLNKAISGKRSEEEDYED